jgi:hypothetical protein
MFAFIIWDIVAGARDGNTKFYSSLQQAATAGKNANVAKRCRKRNRAANILSNVINIAEDDGPGVGLSQALNDTRSVAAAEGSNKRKRRVRMGCAGRLREGESRFSVASVPDTGGLSGRADPAEDPAHDVPVDLPSVTCTGFD